MEVCGEAPTARDHRISPCSAYSSLQTIRKAGAGGEEKLARWRVEAERHWKYRCGLCMHHLRRCLYFVHEHPETAASWTVPCAVKLPSMPGVFVSTVDQCSYSLRARGHQGMGPAKKLTMIVANTVGVTNEMQRRCPGCKGHVNLTCGKAT